MTPVAHLLAAACYLGAAGTGLLAGGSRRLEAAVAWLLGLGVLLQVVGFFGFHVSDPPVPLGSFGAALSLIAWLTVAAFLLSLGLARLRAVGAWVGALAAALTVGASLALWGGPPAAPSLDTGGWPHAHVLLSTAGFAALGLASLFGLAYLAKQRALKSKRPPRALPSLEGLDRVEHVALAIGFPLLTLGLISGFVWSRQHGGELATGHALFTTLAWLLYLVPVTARVVRRQRGQAAARSVVIGFAFLALSYLGVRLWGVTV